jgi:hypothetical protein
MLCCLCGLRRPRRRCLCTSIYSPWSNMGIRTYRPFNKNLSGAIEETQHRPEEQASECDESKHLTQSGYCDALCRSTEIATISHHKCSRRTFLHESLAAADEATALTL